MKTFHLVLLNTREIFDCVVKAKTKSDAFGKARRHFKSPHAILCSAKEIHFIS